MNAQAVGGGDAHRRLRCCLEDGLCAAAGIVCADACPGSAAGYQQAAESEDGSARVATV